MKISSIRFGFANNSSSSHSILFCTDPSQANIDSIPHYGDNGFGWEWFKLHDRRDKLHYLAQLALSNNRESSVRETLEENLPEFIAEMEDFDFDALGDGNFGDDGYIDHQSVITFDNSKQFEGFKKFVLRDDVVIAGGNDNENSPYGFYNGFKILNYRDMSYIKNENLKVRYDKGWQVFFNKNYGDKTRLAFDDKVGDYTSSTYPELVDLKITDYCPHGCKFCYQGSTKRGKHAPFEELKQIIETLAEMEVFEIAIGGGEPTLYPNFVELLYFCKEKDIVPNFTSFNLDWVDEEEILKAVIDCCGSFAISVHSIEMVKKIQDYYDQGYKKSIFYSKERDQSVQPTAQIVLNTMPDEKAYEIIKYIIDETYLNLTFLGFKTTGRGQKFKTYENDFEKYLKFLENRKFGADTVVVQEYKELLDKMGVMEELRVGEEGQFSMYIDAVKKQLGPSSYCNKDEMIDYENVKEEIEKHFPFEGAIKS